MATTTTTTAATTTGMLEDEEELAYAIQLSLSSSDNNFKGYLEGLERDHNPNNASLLDSNNLGSTLASHTLFLSNAESFWRICRVFSDKSETNKGIVQRVVYLIMDSISNTLIAILDNNDFSDDANRFLDSILECSRRTNTKELFEHGLSCVPKYLYHSITNVISRGEILYDQFVPERSATQEDISRFFNGAEIPTDFDALFNSSTHKRNTDKVANIDFNRRYIKDFVADFDKILSLKDLITTSEPSDFISVVSAFLALANAVKIQPNCEEDSKIRESIIPKLFELSRMYFELFSRSAHDGDLGKSVRAFLEIPGSSEVIPGASNVLERVCGEGVVARNLRWIYGLSAILGGILPQMCAEPTTISDTLAVAALGSAIKMFSDGAEVSFGSKEKSLKVEMLPGVEVNLCNPAEGEKVFSDKIRSLGYADQLDFFLKVTNAYWDIELQSGASTLVFNQCVTLLKKIAIETPLAGPTHMSRFVQILEKLSMKADQDVFNFMLAFRAKFIEKKGGVSAETTGFVLEEIYRKYKMNPPFYVLNFVHDIIVSKMWEEQAIFGVLNKFMDDFIAILQVPNGDDAYEHEIISYRVFCLVTYAFCYGLSPESKLAILTKMTNFTISNQDKKLHQLGLIRFLTILTSFFRISWSFSDYSIVQSWDTFLVQHMDPENFPPGIPNPCRVYTGTNNTQKPHNFLGYIAPSSGFIQGNITNITPVVTEFFRAQPALLNIFRKSISYGKNAFLNNYLLVATLDAVNLFHASTEMLSNALSGKLFDPMSMTTVLGCQILQDVSAGFFPMFADTSRLDASQYMNGLNASLLTLSASFDARKKCDPKDEHKLDLIIYCICALYSALVYPFQMRTSNGSNGSIKIFPFPSVINTQPVQGGYMNGYFRNYIESFFAINLERIFQLSREIIEFYFDLRVKNVLGKFGDETLNAANFFFRASLKVDQCFIPPASALDKQNDIRQGFALIAGEVVTEQLQLNVMHETLFYLGLSQEKFSLVNIHAFVSLLIASLNTFRSAPYYPQLIESAKRIYYIDNLYGIDGVLNGATSGEISRTILPQLIRNTANYLSLVVTNVDKNTITPLETIITTAINGFNIYPEREENFNKIVRIFVDVLFLTTNTPAVMALCNFFMGRMSSSIAGALFSVDTDRFEAFLRKATSNSQVEAVVLNTLTSAIKSSPPELVLKAFNPAIKILQELLDIQGGTRESQRDMKSAEDEIALPSRGLRTYAVSLAFAGKCVPRLIAMLTEKGKTSPFARDMLCAIIGFIFGSIPQRPSAFATKLIDNPPPAKKIKIRVYSCHTCTYSFGNFVCCPDCAEICHKGHDLTITEDGITGPGCMCCGGSNNALCCKYTGASAANDTNGINFAVVREFYDPQRDKAQYMSEIVSFRNDLISVLATGVEGYPVPTEPRFTKDSEFFSNSHYTTKSAIHMFNKYVFGDKKIVPTTTPQELQTYYSSMCIMGDNLAICSESKIVFLSSSNIKPTTSSLTTFSGTKEMKLETLPRIMNICPHPVHMNVFAANNANRCSVVLYNRNDFSVLKEASIFIERTIRSVAWNKKALLEICISTDDEVFVYDLEKSVREPVRTVKLPSGAKFKGTAVVSCEESSFIVVASSQSVHACGLSGSAKELTCIVPDIGFEIYAINYLEQLSSLVLSFGDNKKPIVLHVGVSKENGGQLVVNKSSVLFREGRSLGGKSAPVHHFVAFPDTNPIIVGITPERDFAVGVSLCKTQQINMVSLREAAVGVLALRKSPFEQYLVLLGRTGRITYTQYHPSYLIEKYLPTMKDNDIKIFRMSKRVKEYELGVNLLRDEVRRGLSTQNNIKYHKRKDFIGACFDTSGEFKITITNKDPSMVVTGLRIHVGSKNPESLPASIRVFNKKIDVIPGAARWYEVHFTPAEILLSRKLMYVTLYPREGLKKISIDAISPHGIERALVFGNKFPADDETVALIAESTEAGLKAEERVIASSNVLSLILPYAQDTKASGDDEFARALDKAITLILKVAPFHSSLIQTATNITRACPEIVAKSFASFLASTTGTAIPPKSYVQYYNLYLSIMREDQLKDDTKTLLHNAMTEAVSGSLSREWGFAEIKTMLGEGLKVAKDLPRALEFAHLFLVSPNVYTRASAADAIDALLITAYEVQFVGSSKRGDFSSSLRSPKGIGRMGARELVAMHSLEHDETGMKLAESVAGKSALQALLGVLVEMMGKSVADESIESDRLVQEARAISTLVAKVGPLSTLNRLLAILTLDDLDMGGDAARKSTIVLNTVTTVLKGKGSLGMKRARELKAAIRSFPQTLPEQAHTALTILALEMESVDSQEEVFSGRMIESVLLGAEGCGLPDPFVSRRWGYSIVMMESLLIISREMIRVDAFKPLFTEADWIELMDAIFCSDKLYFAQSLAKGVIANFEDSEDFLFKRFDEQLHSEILSLAILISSNPPKLSVRDVHAFARAATKELSVAFQRPGKWIDLCVKNQHVFMALLCAAARIVESSHRCVPASLASSVPVFLYLAGVVSESKEAAKCERLFKSEVLPFGRFVPALCVYHPSAQVRGLATKVLMDVLPLLGKEEVAALADSATDILGDVVAGRSANTSEFMKLVTLLAGSGMAPENFEVCLLALFTDQVKYLSRYRDTDRERNDYGCPFCHEYPTGVDVSLALAEKSWPGEGRAVVSETNNCVSFAFPQKVLFDSITVKFSAKPKFFSVYYKADGTWCLVNYRVAPKDTEAIRLEYPLFVPADEVKIEFDRCKNYARKCVKCNNSKCSIYCTECHSFVNELNSVVLHVDRQSFACVSNEERALSQYESLEEDLERVGFMQFGRFSPK